MKWNQKSRETNEWLQNNKLVAMRAAAFREIPEYRKTEDLWKASRREDWTELDIANPFAAIPGAENRVRFTTPTLHEDEASRTTDFRSVATNTVRKILTGKATSAWEAGATTTFPAAVIVGRTRTADSIDSEMAAWATYTVAAIGGATFTTTILV